APWQTPRPIRTRLPRAGARDGADRHPQKGMQQGLLVRWTRSVTCMRAGEKGKLRENAEDCGFFSVTTGRYRPYFNIDEVSLFNRSALQTADFIELPWMPRIGFP